MKKSLVVALAFSLIATVLILNPAASFAKKKEPKAPTAPASPAAPKAISSNHEAHELAVQLLNQLRQKPESPERGAEEARLTFYTATFSDSTDDQKLPIFEQGRDLALAALKKSPELLNATYWWCANQGASADITRSLGALKQVKLMEDALIKIKYASPEFRQGGAQRVLARMYQRAPGIISIGSMSRSKENFDGLLKTFGTYPGNWIFFADFLIDQKKKAEALDAIHKAESLPTDPSEDALDHYYWQFFRESLNSKLSKL